MTPAELTSLAGVAAALLTAFATIIYSRRANRLADVQTKHAIAQSEFDEEARATTLYNSLNAALKQDNEQLRGELKLTREEVRALKVKMAKLELELRAAQEHIDRIDGHTTP